MTRDRHCLAVPFVMLESNNFLETMGLASWGWSISINVVCIGTPFLPLVKIVPSSYSMTYSNTMHMMDHST